MIVCIYCVCMYLGLYAWMFVYMSVFNMYVYNRPTMQPSTPSVTSYYSQDPVFMHFYWHCAPPKFVSSFPALFPLKHRKSHPSHALSSRVSVKSSHLWCSVRSSVGQNPLDKTTPDKTPNSLVLPSVAYVASRIGVSIRGVDRVWKLLGLVGPKSSAVGGT